MKLLLPITLGSFLLLTACDTTLTGAIDAALHVNLLAKKIEQHLRDSYVGCQFGICHNGKVKAFGASGDARSSHETSPRKKNDLASVGKTVAPAALLHALNGRALKETDTIAPYLPS